MKSIIIAGGLGTRLRPITYEIPKPLITVQKKPIINHILDFFRKHDIKETGIIISVDHERDFSNWFNHWGKKLDDQKIEFFIEAKPLGTFGYLPHIKHWFNNEPIIFSNGDHLIDFDLQSMMHLHRLHRPHATMALVEVPNPKEYGVPVLDQNKIIDFEYHPENPSSNFISAGVYVLEPEILAYNDGVKEVISIENDIFPKIARAGKLIGAKMSDCRLYDCGTLERWEKAIKEW